MRYRRRQVQGVTVGGSLRTQLSLVFLGIMAMMIVSLMVINSVFLERVYLNHKKTVIRGAYASVNAASESGSITSEAYELELQTICERYDIEILVLDSGSQTVKVVSASDAEFLARVLWDDMMDNDGPETVSIDRRIQEETSKYTLLIETDRRTQTDYIEIWGFLDNGNLVLIRGALESIRDSVELSNRFLIYVGLVIIALGSLLILFISGRVTRPIIELTDISEEMRGLNFEAKYESHHIGPQNELDVLGKNINELSRTLETTIRELKNANLELMQDIARKEKLDEERRDFISNVSHELKTPIALIQGYAEGLQEIADDEESRSYYTEVILDEASRMSTMVSSLLALNQLESGIENVTMTRFDVMEIIREQVRQAQILARQSGAVIEVEDKGELYVWADEFKVGEVLQNYISNALHYVSGEKNILVRTEMREDKVRICVFNTGDQIPEEALEHVWEKFYKVDKARSREYGGSGVGLSIVKAIQENMHQGYGVVNYENGVEFWFELETR